MKLARRDYVASLETGLAIIEAFDHEHQRLTLSEVARRTSLTRATARRYLLTLTKLGYADYDGKYFGLDLRVLRLGYGYLAKAVAEIVAQPEVAEKFREFRVDPIGNTPAQMAAFLQEERARWGAVIERTNSRLD